MQNILSIALAVLLFPIPILAQTSAPAPAAFFPIMAWNHVPHDPAVLKQMHDCGLTVAGFCTVKNLDAVHAAGMKAIVSDPRVGGYDWTNVDAAKARVNVQSLIKEVGSHPAVCGYYLRDEPPATYFGGLEKVASVVRELAPGKWPYINLFPNYAESFQLALNDAGATSATTTTSAAGSEYERYIDRFIATCKPPVLSYDHYALYDDGSLGGQYFQNLEQMRAAANRTKVPFWNIVLSVAHFSFAEPTFAGLRFQAYTTLAYGGRGLSYFTYFAPQVGNYRLAPIDQFGNPTATWHFMQNVNLQIAKLAPALLKLTSDDVYHFGTPPAGCHAPGKQSLLTSAGSDQLFAGDFTHEDGSRWVMVVNKDRTKSLPCAPQYRTAPRQVRKLSPYTGDFVAFEGEQIWLAPGAGVLLKLE